MNLRVKTMILDTIKMQKGLFAAILFAVTGAIISALIPPLVLARIMMGSPPEDRQCRRFVSSALLSAFWRLTGLPGGGKRGTAYGIRTEDDACPAQQSDGEV